ncbi:hypothetical protein JEQ12_014927 [Ovis aries]|uniref:Heme-binding protein 1 n=2 Tax=Ovis TaxID=9935 RepID=A0A836D4N0_SHEEP|nr:hypothetical protein JEQ12_014927 [Ovis aries]
MLGMIKNSLFGSVETWPWQVLSKGGKGDVFYEERACEGGKFATVEVTDKPVDEALREAMPKVMKYVGGSNDKGLGMGMTVPISFAVFPSDDGNLQNRLKVWFRIPNKFQSDPPAPSDDSIKIEDREGITVYSTQFGGYAKAADYAAQAAQLRSALESTATYQTDFYFCTGYDPPMKPYGRRNESLSLLSPETPNSGASSDDERRTFSLLPHGEQKIVLVRYQQVNMYEDCKESTGDYYFLCDTEGAWGIVLESLAAVGIVVTVMLLLAFLFLMKRVQDCAHWNVLPTQFLFLLGVLGLFGLAFAFIIQLNEQTAPIRYFLFGVLFALCFSCLLAHASNLVKLVRGRVSFSWTTILCIAIGVSLLQTIIAIEYVTLIMTRGGMFVHMTPYQLNVDFVVLLVYVLFLMALTFFVSKTTFCGPCENWKQHGRLIFATVLVSIIIWVVWISMLMRGNTQLQRQPQWDDPVICIALVTNAWVFLLLYIVPELCILYRSCQQGCPLPGNACPLPTYERSFRAENQELSRARDSDGAEEDVALTAYGSPHSAAEAEEQGDGNSEQNSTHSPGKENLGLYTLVQSGGTAPGEAQQGDVQLCSEPSNWHKASPESEELASEAEEVSVWVSDQSLSHV